MTTATEWMAYIMDRKRWPHTGTILVAPETAHDARPEEYMLHHSDARSPIPTTLSPGETVDDLVRQVEECRPGCLVLKHTP